MKSLTLNEEARLSTVCVWREDPGWRDGIRHDLHAAGQQAVRHDMRVAVFRNSKTSSAGKLKIMKLRLHGGIADAGKVVLTMHVVALSTLERSPFHAAPKTGT